MATEVFGEGTKIYEFTSFKDDTIHYDKVDLIDAGTPLLIMAANAVTNPMFKGVNITVTEPKTVTHDGCSFVGTFSLMKKVITGTEGVKYFGYMDGQFVRATKSMTLKGFTAMLEIVDAEENTETTET